MFSSGEEQYKPTDYLVKPVEKKQFEKTMERLYVSMQNAGEVVDYYERIENVEPLFFRLYYCGNAVDVSGFHSDFCRNSRVAKKRSMIIKE